MSPEPFRSINVFMSRSEVAIARLLPGDAQWLTTWLNDPLTTRWMATGRVPALMEQVAAQIMGWYEPLAWPFAVLVNDQKEQDGQYQAIGYVGLFDVDVVTRKAEFRILLGAPNCGKGYGTEATKLMLDFGFRRLGLQRIWLGVTDANIPALKCYERCGFVREGILRRDLYRDGQFYDSVRMSVLDHEYIAREHECLIAEEKHPEILGSGPATAASAMPQWTGFFGREEASQRIDPTPSPP